MGTPGLPGLKSFFELKRKRFYTIFLAIAAPLVIWLGYRERSYYYLQVREVNAASADSIVLLADSLVAPVLYHNVRNLGELSPADAKHAFNSVMLPAVLVVKHRIALDRERIQQLGMKQEWTTEDSIFFETQGDYYKTFDLPLLLRRMRTHPNSIILAQAAVETGWGSSRFFSEANNAFGIWSYRTDEPRIRASYSRNGRPVYLRKYDDIPGSIQDYFGVVARARAYRHFRQARDTTDDVGVLLPLLRHYSERKEAYVAQLNTIIRQNRMTRYDTWQLDPSYFVEVKIISMFGYDVDSSVSAATTLPDLRDVRPFPAESVL